MHFASVDEIVVCSHHCDARKLSPTFTSCASATCGCSFAGGSLLFVGAGRFTTGAFVVVAACKKGQLHAVSMCMRCILRGNQKRSSAGPWRAAATGGSVQTRIGSACGGKRTRSMVKVLGWVARRVRLRDRIEARLVAYANHY